MSNDSDLKTALDRAIASYDSDPEPLRQLTRELRQNSSRKLCHRAAKLLNERDPQNLEALASLIYCQAMADRKATLRTSLDRAHQRAAGDPAVLEQIFTAVRQSLTAQDRDRVEALLSDYDGETGQIAERRRSNLAARDRLLQRRGIEPNSCDVITVASNEGPYIAEFIHHYLYLGFSGIYIGLNNDHSGRTGPIVEAIQVQHPQVHLINTDREHQQGQQRSSYSRLYDAASRSSTASHCMVVDVDEAWVPQPFESSISTFLAAHGDADVVSSNWLHCHGGELFGSPLDLAHTRLRLTDQFKSLFRYGLAVTDLGAHVPWVLAEPPIHHTSSDGQVVLSSSVGDLRRLRKRGIQANINCANTGWVIHRHTRSELEYASKLLYPDVNKQEIPFKPNRKGFVMPPESQQALRLASRLFGPSLQPPQAYTASYQRFITRCGIQPLISDAQAEINEAEITQRIEQMEPRMIQRHRAVWEKTFRGTRFLALLDRRARKATDHADT